MTAVRKKARRLGWLAVAGAITLAAGAARAQTDPSSGDKAASGEAPRDKLRGVETAIERSGFEQRRLGYEIENLSREAERLSRTLVEAAGRVRAAEQRALAEEAELADIAGREAALRRSLLARERVIAEILAAMQRIGRKPPPAVLVAPEDVIGAMRAAILLGAVLPDMRDEAMVLIADLKTLSELRRQAAASTQRLAQERDLLLAERTRLAGLVEARKQEIGLSRGQLAAETAKVAALAREARSLRDLIARSENEIVGATRAAEIARRAPAPQRSSQDVASLRPEAPRELPRMQPRRPLADLRGQIALPVSGSIGRQFGQPDGLGGSEKGLTILSTREALVTAPTDGWIHFAGPYRGYGQLLIINAGGGYHIVLAGLGRLTVEIGQFVLAGEPLGFLGQSSAIMPGEGIATTRPALYVEFRKDGSPIDPSPWWSQQSAEKARG